MKLPSDYNKGDKVIVIGQDELQQLLSFYGTGEELSDQDIQDVAGTIATILWVPGYDDIDAWDGWIPVKTNKLKVLNLPFAALLEIPVTGIVEEPDDEEEVKIVRDKESEGNLVMQLAAETIQSTYRRYRACKPAMKLRRVSSEEKLVMSLAADTIKQSFRSKRKNREGRPPRVPTTADQTSISNSPYSTPPRTSRSDYRSSQDSQVSPARSIDTADCAVDKSYTQMLQTPPTSPPRPDIYPPFSSLYLHVSDIRGTNMKAIKWTGRNDPYVVLSIGQWRHETEVMWSADDEVTWKNVNAIGLYRPKQGSDDNDCGNMLRIEVYDANLVRDNQLIGLATYSLQGVVINTDMVISVDIHDSGNKQIYRGHLDLTVVIKESSLVDAVTVVNSHNLKKEEGRRNVAAGVTYDGSRITNSDQLQNNNLKDELTTKSNLNVEKSGEIQSTTQKSVQLPRNDNKRHTAESESESYRGKHFDSRVPISTSSNASCHENPATQAHTYKPTSRRVERSNRGVDARTKSKAISRQNESGNTSKRENRTYDRSQTAQVGTSSQRENDRSDKKSPTILQTSLSEVEPKLNKTKNSKPKKTSKRRNVEEWNGLDFRDIDISPDIHKRVVDKAFEIALLEESASIYLRKLEVLLVLDALDVAVNPHARNTPTSGSSGVLLSLQSPALFAASLTQYARDNDLVNCNVLKISPKQFCLTKDQSITAMKQLIGLVQGTWKKSRNLVLDAAENSIESGGSRPALWISNWVSDLATILQFPNGRFDSFTGKDFMLMSDSEIASRLQPSILRARCRVYRCMLCHLDVWWDRGMRPRDILSKHNSLCKTVDTMYQSGSKVNKDHRYADGDYVKLASSDRLLQAYMPICRAYSWSVPIEDMTTLCDIIGSTQCVVNLRKPVGANTKDMVGTQWVRFTDDTPSLNSKGCAVADLLQIYDGRIDVVCGRCVCVPLTCVQPCPSQGKGASTPTLLTDIPIECIVDGMEVQIQSLDTLCRAYERFDWWDRPSSSTLSSIAGKRGRVVSCASANETRRVGVSVTGPNSTKIVDAVPLEALEYVSKKESDRPGSSAKRKHQEGLRAKSLGVNSSELAEIESTKSKNKIVSRNSVELPHLKSGGRSNKSTSNGKSTSKISNYGGSNVVSSQESSIPRRRSYKSWMKPPATLSLDMEITSDTGDNQSDGTPIQSNPVRDMWSMGMDIGGGDESAPPDPDERISENETPTDIPNPEVEVRSNNIDDSDTVASYSWMQRSPQTDKCNDSKVSEVRKPRTYHTSSPPKLSTTKLEFDSSSLGTPISRSQNEKNLADLTANMKRSKARTEELHKYVSKKNQAKDSINQDDDSISLGVSGVGFSNMNSGHESGEVRAQRPESARADRRVSAHRSDRTRPSSACNSRATRGSRPKRPWSQEENVTTKNDSNYDEHLWRELKRTEKEAKFKEAALLRQLKKMGVYEEYKDMPHEL
mmetsp:Transcript_22367/g.32590  ORF Transcript_22367/g.32590 Transcript_22367/m.32590 type:complete len:1458 (-) Transcript_22367:130-4503(-)|eukprot:CAMPEP_0185038684 /NCGR_PEP_ID=MMETSP1103-20130426/34634_1 /TAXON_ID=36769 /ORGANISM="Paraphysomonas bandaiensis, Strain Caron Lab Isolate" /LENGTH=1457 /DNA_ID=CAMNT_0027577223 /DNA_START=195 /DNA_END=4568 /DNA_ORIENTATION=-